jgi:branched-chain amino acid transport system substrate-binding protein
MHRFAPALLCLAHGAIAAAAGLPVRVGVTLAATGSAASLGVPSRNAVALLPREMGGAPVEWIVLDDATDSTAAVRNARKLTGEHAVDVLVGSNTVPSSLAMIDVAAETGTPMISLAAGRQIVEPVDERRRWVFKTPQNDALMADAIGAHMAARGIGSAAFIGFADAYGDGWWSAFSKVAEARGVKVVASERWNRPDTSVTGQVLRILAARPDAVLVAGAGTPAALPQKALAERGYRGVVYQTHGAANAEFLRVGGKDVEGAFLPVGPVVVAAQLPDDHPCKAPALEFVRRYEAANGPGTASSFAAHAWDAGLLLQVAVPRALAQARPGTREFRAALRTALEGVSGLRGAHGVFDLSPSDHLGLDERARVMAEVRGGAFRLVR